MINDPGQFIRLRLNSNWIQKVSRSRSALSYRESVVPFQSALGPRLCPSRAMLLLQRSRPSIRDAKQFIIHYHYCCWVHNIDWLCITHGPITNESSRRKTFSEHVAITKACLRLAKRFYTPQRHLRDADHYPAGSAFRVEPQICALEDVACVGSPHFGYAVPPYWAPLPLRC